MEYNINKIGNWGHISPVPTGKLATTLEKYMMYERPGKQFMPDPTWAIVRLYHVKTGRFPYGLLHIVKAILKKYCETVPNNTYKINYRHTPITHIPHDPNRSLRPYQLDAVNALINNHGGIIVMPCGAGKTKTIIEYLKIMNLHTLVLCPTKDIRKQWQDYRIPNVIVSTYANPKLKLKGVMDSYDIVVCDECHHASAKSIYSLMMLTKTDAILVGCSATVKREDGEDLKVHGALGKIIYTITRKDLISQGYLANARVMYLKPQFETNGKYMHYQEVYNKEIIHNDHRNNLAVSAAIADARNGRKVLMLVSTIEHGEILLDKLKPFSLKTIFMNGQSKDRDQDMTKWDIIVATSIYDEGYDLKGLDTLILVGSGKSKIKITQRAGRVLRPKPDGRESIIYDFVDTPKYLRQQYITRRTQLGEEFQVFEVDEQQKLVIE